MDKKGGGSKTDASVFFCIYGLTFAAAHAQIPAQGVPMSFKKWLYRLWPWYVEPLKKQSDLDLVDTYCEAGLAYAEVYLDLEFGTADDFDELLQRWVETEDEMLRRNLMIFPLDSFVRAHAGRQNDIDGLGERIPPEVTPVAYARQHREKFIQNATLRSLELWITPKNTLFLAYFCALTHVLWLGRLLPHSGIARITTIPR